MDTRIGWSATDRPTDRAWAMFLLVLATLALIASVGAVDLDPCSGVCSTYVDPVTNVRHDCWLVCYSIIRAHREYCKEYCPEYYHCQENSMSTTSTVPTTLLITYPTADEAARNILYALYGIGGGAIAFAFLLCYLAYRWAKCTGRCQGLSGRLKLYQRLRRRFRCNANARVTSLPNRESSHSKQVTPTHELTLSPHNSSSPWTDGTLSSPEPSFGTVSSKECSEAGEPGGWTNNLNRRADRNGCKNGHYPRTGDDKEGNVEHSSGSFPAALYVADEFVGFVPNEPVDWQNDENGLPVFFPVDSSSAGSNTMPENISQSDQSATTNTSFENEIA